MALWTNSKALQLPIHESLKTVNDLPYTISFAIRKRIQVDNMYELPKDKRPPDSILWDGTSDELEEWLDRVLDRNKSKEDGVPILISEIEG